MDEHLGSFLIGLVACPLLPGLINRVKSAFAGRTGPSILQAYFDLGKLARKGAVYSRTSSWILKAGPIVGLASALAALMLIPWGGQRAMVAFEGDLILLAYLLGLMRFAAILAALDTGSAFEGMGASREAQFAVLTEPALLLALAALARLSGSLSLSEMIATLSGRTILQGGLGLLLASSSLAVVFLAENARLPIDDPNTHLELTMIHEVMVLDHGGPDLGFILYGSALKLWILGSLLVGMLMPWQGIWALDALLWAAGMVALAALTGVVESVTARLRMSRVPQLLVAACVMSALALTLVWVR